mmetsp:Transcript_10125/g.22783  ORF Transcript_10125/g.22783 Transcript_10125/m.22783 type:complete len:670 (-) Transcript_10125:21-2030(-)
MAKAKAAKTPGGALNRGNKKGQGALKPGSAFRSSNSSALPGRTTPKGETRVKTGSFSHYRTEGTIKRLAMYNKKPDMKRMKEQKLAPARIQPDRRWFGNTRVIAQDKMQAFRETMAKKVQDPYSVVLKSSKLPMSLLRDTEDKSCRMNLLQAEPFSEVFGKKRQQKRAKLSTYDVTALVDSATQKASQYDNKKDTGSTLNTVTGQEREAAAEFESELKFTAEVFKAGTSRRIWGELYKVVDSSDVIIEVLDARDPMGTRCMQLEQELRRTRSHKHLILLLNKVDLVPTWVTKKWVQLLTKEFPTLAFHASITNPFGKSALLNLLRQMGGLLKERKHVTVGLIGYPNVGKSSVVNALKKKKVCNAAPVPGETKIWQYVALTKRLYLLDCPGIVPPSASDFMADCAKVLKGVVRAERIESPSDYIDEVLSRVKRPYLLQKYRLPADATWTNGEEFLTLVGKKMGKLVKGGDADLDTTARIVLYDWQRGRIPYFTPPPDEASTSSTSEKDKAAAESGPPAAEDASSRPEEEETHVDGGASTSVATGTAAASSSDTAQGSAASGNTEAEQMPLVVRQSLEELACSAAFDDEDMRGESGASGEKRKATDAAATSEGAKKKRRKRGGAGKLQQSENMIGPEGTAPQRGGRRSGGGGAGLQRGMVDWSKVVAEFGT